MAIKKGESRRGAGRPVRVTYEAARRIALGLPGAEEGFSYGTPAFRVGGKFWFRLREDGDTLAMRMGFEEREALIAHDPQTFYLTDHYVNYPAVLLRLSSVRRDVLRAVLEESWRASAPPRLRASSQAVARGRAASGIKKGARGRRT